MVTAFTKQHYSLPPMRLKSLMPLCFILVQPGGQACLAVLRYALCCNYTAEWQCFHWKFQSILSWSCCESARCAAVPVRHPYLFSMLSLIDGHTSKHTGSKSPVYPSTSECRFETANTVQCILPVHISFTIVNHGS